MYRPIRIEYPGAYYHITARGNEQKNIYRSDRDREKFLQYLGSATERYSAIISYVELNINNDFASDSMKLLAGSTSRAPLSEVL
jgi:REP element-mobilizing transposase RayT